MCWEILLTSLEASSFFYKKPHISAEISPLFPLATPLLGERVRSPSPLNEKKNCGRNLTLFFNIPFINTFVDLAEKTRVKLAGQLDNRTGLWKLNSQSSKMFPSYVKKNAA